MLGLLAESGLVPVSYTPHDVDEHGEERADSEARGGGPAPSNNGADDFAGADAVVVNTCGFLEASKEESLGVIREAIRAKEEGRVKRVVVAGCLVQRHRARMLEWAPGIDAMVGVFDRDRIVEAVRGGPSLREGAVHETPPYWIASNALQAARDRGVRTTGLTVNGKDGKGVGYFEDDSARLRLTPRHYAYLRISEGCNQNCTFCTIPSIRGKMRSKSPERVEAETRELLLDGAFELNLIGQDTTSWGDDIGVGLGRGNAPGGLPMLLRTVSEAVRETTGAGWVRLMYAYPSNFSEPIIDAFADLCARGHVVPYIDMPLQHASDSILSAMRRNVTTVHQRALIRRLRERVPGIAIRTTFISGFPGETEEDHVRLLDFVRESRFEAMGVFEYSREDRTPAGTMEADPSVAVVAEAKARRRAELMEIQQHIAFERGAALASEFKAERPDSSGRRLQVLIDRATPSRARATTGVGRGGSLYLGRAYFQAPQIDSVTYVQSREKLAPGELVPCVIVGSDGYDLVARPVAEIEKKVPLRVL